MMRGPSNWAVAVRKPDGQIAQVCRPIESPMKRHWVFRLPVIRGVVALGESLAIGFRALAISANYAAQEEGADGEARDRALARRARSSPSRSRSASRSRSSRSTPALLTDLLPIRHGTGWFVVVEGADPRHDLHRSTSS